MTTELTFYGGVIDYHKSEMGGIQIRLNYLMIDFGQRPDHYNLFYGFYNRPRNFESLKLHLDLELLPSIPGIYRHDYTHHLGMKEAESPIRRFIYTHSHFDHIGGMHFLKPDILQSMNQMSLWIANVWQYTSGRTINQFVDLYDQFSLFPKKDGDKRFVYGEEGRFPRKFHIYESGVPFYEGDIKITPYLVDHSLPGACGLIIETPDCKIGISGDIRLRGRRPEDSEKFINTLLEERVDYLIWEASLMHFPHEGTEKDVANITADLIDDKTLAIFASPPRDLDRLASMYWAARKTKRMLVINPMQALLLKQFNGANGYPRLTSKYIGVLLHRKNKGIIDREDEFPEYLIERDYFEYERWFLERSRWDEEEGHQSKITRVSIDDIKNNQDQFFVYSPAHRIDMLNEINPALGSIYVRSHPAPWTKEMEVDEERLINTLKWYKMYDGPQPDYLNPTEMRLLHQVHITGHMNEEENRRILGEYNGTVIPYHTMDPQLFKQDYAKHTKVLIPTRKQTYQL